MKNKSIVLLLASLAIIMYSCQSGSGYLNEWQPLFNGDDLTGWEIRGQEGSFRSEGGMIIAEGHTSLLYYNGALKGADFKNFELKADVMTSTDAGSAIFFHTRMQDQEHSASGYKLQILNSDKEGSDFRKTSSLVNIRNVYKALPSDNQWFNLHIVVTGNRVQVFINGVQTIDYTEPQGVKREDHLAGSILSSGTIALQSSSNPVYFKNIMLMPLSDKATLEAGKEYFSPEKQEMVNTLIGRGYPIVDYHIHMKGGVTLEDILDKSRRTGIFCSVAPNCGVGFPIDTNEKLEDFYDEYKDVPIFLAMQAEGREWVNTFEKESIAKYDYVFTDAMTFSDRKGKRMQIWIDEQVEIDDPQDFMELLVSTIEDVLDNEKIDIYVNPTFLPTVIRDSYDELWTEERMDRVVDALVRNDIALEISARYQIPGPALIKKAKERGVQFTFGTNNSDHDYANLDYCFEMIQVCDIRPEDMFLPRPHGQKPVQIK